MAQSQIIEHGLHDGHMLKEARLKTAELSLSILNFGAATRDLRYTVSGADRPLVLGYENPSDYLVNPAYMGVIAGRLAGRTKDARFVLEGQEVVLDANEGNNHLHGGGQGLSHVFWDLHLLDSATAQLTYTSPDGENGYPGTAKFTVAVNLTDSTLTYDMRAEVDRPTPISLAQHNYYNLAGGAEAIWDHRLQVDADRVLLLDATNVPSGESEAISGSRMAPDGLRMRVFSDQPGAQFYTAGGMGVQAGALPGQKLGPSQGICIEPQGFPNAVNCPNFPSVIATPDTPYRQTLRLEFDQT